MVSASAAAAAAARASRLPPPPRLVLAASARSVGALAPADVVAGLTPTHFRVALRRSTIGLPEKLRAVARRMGLVKMHAAQYVGANPTSAAGILALRHVVAVDCVYLCSAGEFGSRGAVTRHVALDMERRARRSADGYTVVEADWRATRPWTLRGSPPTSHIAQLLRAHAPHGGSIAASR